MKFILALVAALAISGPAFAEECYTPEKLKAEAKATISALVFNEIDGVRAAKLVMAYGASEYKEGSKYLIIWSILPSQRVAVAVFRDGCAFYAGQVTQAEFATMLAKVDGQEV